MIKLHKLLLSLSVPVVLVSQALALTPQIEGSIAPIVYKPGADVLNLHPEIEAAYTAVVATWSSCKAATPVITSGRDSLEIHKQGSLHGVGAGAAIDLRGRYLSANQVACILALLPKRLPRPSHGRYVLLWEAPDGYGMPRAHFHLGFRDEI